MKQFLRTAVLLLLVAAAPLTAQQRPHVLFTTSKHSIAPGSFGLLSTSHAMTLDFNRRSFRTLNEGELEIASMPLTPDRTVDLDLREFSVLTPDASVTVMRDDGPHRLTPTVRTFKGRVVGDTASVVFMAVGADGVTGSITTHGVSYELATGNLPMDANRIAVAVYPSGEMNTPADHCGINDEELFRHDGFTNEQMRKMMDTPAPPRAVASPPDVDYMVKYAVFGVWECDYEFYEVQFGGDEQAAADFMVATVARASEVYERELETQLVVSHLRVWATQSQGYPYTESGNMYIAVRQVRDYWTQPERVDTPRGLAYCFSGKAWDNPVGIANDIGPLCNKYEAAAYSLAKKIDPSGAWYTMAHECGHLFGAYHTHNCTWNPEIDRCYFAEMGSCFTSAEVKDTVGTIMSYCSMKIPTFHDRVINFLRNRLATIAAAPPGDGNCLMAARKLTIVPPVVFFHKTTLNNPVDTTITDFFRNNGAESITVSEISFAGKNPDEYEVVSPAIPFEIAAGDRADLVLRYKASKTEAAQVVMTVKHDGYNAAANVTLEAYAEQQLPILGMTGDIDFGKLKVGDIADTTINRFYINGGTAPLHVDETMLVGPDRLDFQLTGGTGPFDLDGTGDGQPLSIRFTPRSPGEKQAWLRVSSNSSTGGVDSIRLTATVRTGPLLQMSVHDLTINFGQRLKGRQYDTTFSGFFYNAGTDTLVFEGYKAGPDPDPFIFLAPVNELAPGDQRDFDLTLFIDPTEQDGWKRAYLLIQIDGHNSPDTIQMIANAQGVAGVATTGSADDGTISVVPNPTRNDADVRVHPLKSEVGSAYTLSVVDVNGREVDHRDGRFAPDGFTYRFILGDKPAGVYYVVVTSDTHRRVRTVTVTP